MKNINLLVLRLRHRYFEGGKGGIAPPNLSFAPCHKGTTISFTESLTKFCCFYALQHKIILYFRVKTHFAPHSGGPRSAYGLLRDTLYYCKSKLNLNYMKEKFFALVWFRHARFEELGSQLC